MAEYLADLAGTAVVAAVVAGLVAVGTNVANAQRLARQRQKETWAEAYRAYVAYREYPFLVRRRSATDPDAERVRLSTALSDVQMQLSYYAAWAAAESPRVGAVYQHLLAEARRVAGSAISTGWDQPALGSDADMHITDVDLTELRATERLFMAAVRAHLHPWRSLTNRGGAEIRRRIRDITRAGAAHAGQTGDTRGNGG